MLGATHMIAFGCRPHGLQVELTPGSTFSAGLRSSAGNWAPGTEIKLVFGAIEWPAAITADLASWTKSPSAVQAVIDSGSTAVTLWYSDGTSPVKWACGKVKVTS
jgi:hypothetical protein